MKNYDNGNLWGDKYCPDAATCGKKWVIEGGDYRGMLEVDASGDGFILTFVTQGQNRTNVGMRLYLYVLKEAKSHQLFNQIDKEFTFSVDVSNLPRGLNGTLYFM
jgi:cellulose 1,4-beta-cellobiosidase